MSRPGEFARARTPRRTPGLGRLALCVLWLASCLGAASAQTDASGAVRATAPRWSEADIRASRIETAGAATPPHRPPGTANPLSLFVVVESDAAHVSLIDGDRFDVIHRWQSRPALHVAPRFSPDGRFAYFGTRDGWITRFDFWNQAPVAEVRAGLGLGSLAISRDGRWLMAVGSLSRTLLLFDASLNLVKTWAVGNRDGTAGSRVAAIVDAGPRRSFVVALRDLPELWEISYDPKAEDFYDGLVHDYRMGEGLPTRGFLNPRRTALSEALDSLFVHPWTTEIAGVAPAQDGGAVLHLVNLDVRRRIASLPLAGAPRPGKATAFDRHGTRLLAVPNRERAAIDMVDLRTWTLVKTIDLPHPVSFIRSHDTGPYLWADAGAAATSGESLTAIDALSLEVVTALAEPGRSLAHVAYSNDGRHMLASTRDTDRALIVLDARSFRAVKRLPVRQPAAISIYNVGEQIKHPDLD